MEEAEDFSPIDQAYLENHPYKGGKKFFPSGSHIYKVTLLINESISTTPQQVSHTQVRGRGFLPIHTYSSVSFHHPWWIQQLRLLVHIFSRN